MKKPAELTRDEARILAAFRTMDTRRKGELLPFAEWSAKTFPASRPPMLRLIMGGSLENCRK